MNVQHAPQALTENREPYSYARVPGRWLLLARVCWVALVVLTLGIFFASLPVYIALLQTPCTGAACEWQQLTPGQVETFKGVGLSLSDYAAYTVALRLVTVVVCLVVSTLIVWRRSDDRMALLVALLLVTSGPIFSSSVVPYSLPTPWQVLNDCLIFLVLALFLLVFSLFPSGQFVPSFMRWILVVFLVGLLPLSFFHFAPLIPNTPDSQPGWLVFVGEFAILALIQTYRYRRVSSPLQRQQTKWVVFGFAVTITIFVIMTVSYVLFPVLASPGSLYPLAHNLAGILAQLLIPLSFGFAMLRYRLWDIDIIIRRTLIYSTLTVVLAVIYELSVYALQAFTSSLTFIRGNQLAIVASTFLIAGLFKPVHDRTRALIDRRFYRSKYDAAKTVAAFSATLRQQVNLDELREQLLAVVQETMQPAHVSLWLCAPKRSSDKTTQALPLIHSVGNS